MTVVSGEASAVASQARVALLDSTKGLRGAKNCVIPSGVVGKDEWLRLVKLRCLPFLACHTDSSVDCESEVIASWCRATFVVESHT
jgi:hypothetical protein